jgi:glycosyltransferase involved in cell wall biosynthesis
MNTPNTAPTPGHRTLQIVGNSSYGGGGYLLIRWCKYLSERGWQVEVLATDPVVVDELEQVPVRVVKSIYIPREIAPVKDMLAFVQLVSLLRREQYDVVHTYTATPGFLGRFAARLAGVPVVLHHQAGWTVTEFSSPFERILFTPLEYLATLASTKSICVSRAVARQARQLNIAPQRKLVTICNGIDPEPFVIATTNNSGVDVRRELGITPECLLIGNIGRLAAQKDNATLIRSIAFLKAILPERSFLLVLAGDGSERVDLENLAHSSGVSEYVRFLGFYTNVPGLLAALDVFVSASLWEGLSISLLEAMASARPIVITNILPNAELIEHEVTGLLVPPKSPEQIAEAIARFARESDLAQCCAAAARQRVLDQYTLDRMFQETWDLYLDLLHGK